MNAAAPTPAFRCPTCRSEVGKDGPHRPFCSDRCRMVDLGAWLLGHYRIPAVDGADGDGGGLEPEARSAPSPKPTDEEHRG